MTYSCSDQSDRLAELLEEKGYTVHNGDATTGETVDDESGDDWWFTWVAKDCDLETGPTCADELLTWSSAMEHWFANAEIRTHLFTPMRYALDARERATVLAALRCYQQVRAECGGDIPDDLQDIADDGGTIEALESDDIDALCERINQ